MPDGARQGCPNTPALLNTLVHHLAAVASNPWRDYPEHFPTMVDWSDALNDGALLIWAGSLFL